MKTLPLVCAASILIWPVAASAQAQAPDRQVPPMPTLPAPAAPVPAPEPAPAPAPAPKAVPTPRPDPDAFFYLQQLEHLPDLNHQLENAWAIANEFNFQTGHAPFHPLRLADGQVKVSVPEFAGVFPANDPYSRGLSALQRRQYDRAITQFESLIQEKAPRADGALYWTAFAHFRSGRSSEALETIAALRRDYPQSRYLTDAKVLETDARRLAGQSVDLASLDNDDIKLLAIQGLRESERVVPLLEDLLGATNSLPVKQRAIYVLALSDDPRARDVLLRYAKGGGNPDLQVEAIRYLATRRDADTSMLVDLYSGQTDVRVRRSIVRALGRPEHAEALVALARKESDRELRTEMVQVLSSLAPHSPAAADYLVELIR